MGKSSLCASLGKMNPKATSWFPYNKYRLLKQTADMDMLLFILQSGVQKGLQILGYMWMSTEACRLFLADTQVNCVD